MKSMHWFNEPKDWQATENGLRFFVTPKTDFWRKTHYGFTVDDGPFYYAERGGEFEVKVKIQGDYTYQYDQMGLMLRIDEKNWIKTGVEFVDGTQYVSAVVTRDFSDWSVVKLNNPPKALWLKAVRRIDSVEIYYSLDDIDYTMLRLAYFPDNQVAKVGMVAASPDGEGFDAHFSDFIIKHLPDQRRLAWLAENV